MEGIGEKGIRELLDIMGEIVDVAIPRVTRIPPEQMNCRCSYHPISEDDIDINSPCTSGIIEILSQQPEKEKMKNANTAALFQDNMTTIQVVFDTKEFELRIKEGLDISSIGQHGYTYKVEKDCGVKVDDYVVVPANGELKVVRVIAVNDEPQIDYDTGIKYQWAICGVEFTEYLAAQESEKKFYDMLRESEKKVIRDQLLDSMTEQFGIGVLESDAVKSLRGVKFTVGEK